MTDSMPKEGVLRTRKVLSRREAIEQGIASNRIEGLILAEADAAILERCANEEITIEEAKALILARYSRVKTDKAQGD